MIGHSRTSKMPYAVKLYLEIFDKSKPVFIEVDASGHGLGAALSQGNVEQFELDNASQTDGKFLEFRNRLHPIAFASKSLRRLKQDIQTLEERTTRCGLGNRTL